MPPKYLVIYAPYQGRCESCCAYLAEVRTASGNDSEDMVYTAAIMAEAMLTCKQDYG